MVAQVLWWPRLWAALSNQRNSDRLAVPVRFPGPVLREDSVGADPADCVSIVKRGLRGGETNALHLMEAGETGWGFASPAGWHRRYIGEGNGRNAAMTARFLLFQGFAAVRLGSAAT